MKELLLAKSNIRKSKGLTVGLILLITLAACFFNIVLILFTDFNTNAEKHAKNLNSEDAYIEIVCNHSEITDDYIKSLITEDVEDYEVNRQIGTMVSINTPYSDGTVSPSAIFYREEEIFKHKIGRSEAIEKDSSITENFVYLPYQYHTGGGFNIGDNYEIKLYEKTYNLKIKGFLNNVLLGSYNLGKIEMVLSDDIYAELEDKFLEDTIIKFKLKDGVNADKFINSFADNVAKQHPESSTFVVTLDSAYFSRTFISLIFGALFTIISLIILIIVLLMLSNNISNYIKENIKTLGAIKALGYTNKDIKVSFLSQFSIIGIIGSILGIGLSYVLAPVVTGIISAQAGFPYEVTFCTVPTIITAVASLLIVILSVLFFVRKTNKIEPITALREGIKTHNFKKNRVKLEKTKLNINIALALKTTLFNIKQNIATFVIVFFLVYMSVIGLVLYQNFAVTPKLSLLTFEVCDAAIGITDSSMNDEIYDYLNSMPEVENLRLVTNSIFNLEDARLSAYILENSDELKNQDVCYKGRLPKYDNEVAISGKFCESYNYKIGDEAELSIGDKKEKYIISGFIQTVNNNGQECVLLESGAKKILGENIEKTYYFETKSDTKECLSKIEERYGDKVISFNFEEIISGSSSIFVVVAGSLLIVIFVISLLVILLVLYLLIKTLINNKKKDYGILKAVGYTSKNIILQNALSFMPTIILSVIASSIISYFIVNPSICLIMNMFGIMKVTFDIPVNFIIITGIAFVVISFLIAVMLSRKVKKIEPYKLLTED